ncbi:MAG: BRO-N domain-containing protein [Sarcina sp.]
MEDIVLFENKEFGKLKVINMNEKEYFIANEVAELLGYSNTREAILRHCKGVVKHDTIKNEGGYELKLITEGDLYRLIIRSKLPMAEKFESWIMDEVLPEIRKNRMYVGDNATDEQKQYNYKMIDVTFNNCSIEVIKEKYEECLRYHTENKTRIPYAKNSKKRSDATHTHTDSRLKIMDKILNTLEVRATDLMSNNRIALAYEVNEAIKQIKDDKTSLGCRQSGGKLAQANGKVKKLSYELDEAYKTINELTEDK